MEQLLIINKPLNWTSMDVIRKVRNILKIKKVGHAGTLDPLATGVLLVCTGTMTKKISQFMDMTKQYTATINLTAFSETDDTQGPINPVEITQQPSSDKIKNVLQTFVGTIEQVPPNYSAIKVQGRRSYKRARNNEQFELPARTVVIHDIELISYQWPLLQINVTCGKGTYIRALARDIGKKLQTGGYLSGLTRTAIGPYTLNQAITLDQLQSQHSQNLTNL